MYFLKDLSNSIFQTIIVEVEMDNIYSLILGGVSRNVHQIKLGYMVY